MKPEHLIAILKDKFYQELEKKTGWGRNEIKKTLEDCAKKVLEETGGLPSQAQ